MIPSRIYLSKNTWNRLQYLQTRTRLTPNVLARITIMMAAQDIDSIKINIERPRSTHVINREVLFGEHERNYIAIFNHFYSTSEEDYNIESVIRTFIDHGLHKVGHIKDIGDLYSIFY